MNSIISVRCLSTGYGKNQILFGVNLDVGYGEILLISGGNGSGKSTLLKSMCGLLPPWNSDAKIHFRPVADGPDRTTRNPAANLSAGLAYLPQKDAVFDDLLVEDNFRLAGYTFSQRSEYNSRREEVLTVFRAFRGLLGQKPQNISGGHRQMLAWPWYSFTALGS